jgi:type II secretory ATPase GspE/PulE/Tfp pilus assembly ATPase PilB-like protein
MPIDREARKQLANGDLRGAYVHARRSLRMLTMQEAALLKVRDGVTSLEEVARIFVTNQTKAAKPAPAATS